MVRLKAFAIFSKSKEYPCFNSKMVRLKGSLTRRYVAVMISFNSKMVRLKEMSKAVLGQTMTSFNSKMVRLKG